MQKLFLALTIILSKYLSTIIHQDLFLYAKMKITPIFLVCVLASLYINLTQAQVIWKREPRLRKCTKTNWSGGKPVVGIFS